MAQDKPGDITATEPVEPYIINIDLRTLSKPAPWRPGDPIKEVPKIRTHKGSDYRNQDGGLDPLLSNQERGTVSDFGFGTPILNYEAQGYSGVNPPDPSGDVGVDYFIHSINDEGGATYVIYNKSDGSVAAGPITMGTLGSGACASGLGDPIILYDELAGRWMISEFSGAGNVLCMYISQTGDPVSGGWFAYSFTTPNFPDYPKYGVWPDGYYVTTNENAPRIHVMDRQAMLNGDPATMVSTALTDLSGFGFQAATPADHDGELGPAGDMPGIIMRHRDEEAHGGGGSPDQDFLEIYTFTVDFANPGNSVLSPVFDVAIADIDSDLCGLVSFSCIDQPGGPGLDPLREVIMNKLSYRNFENYEVLTGNLATDITGGDLAGIRWFELRRSGGGDWTLFQEGTFAPDTDVNRWMAGSAMDSAGNIAMAYNVSNATDTFPGLRYTGRLATDPLGTMPQGEHNIIDGSAANASNRYGDYNQMGVDPVDGCTFWFTGEYNPASTWSTRVVTFKFDGCGECVEPPPTLGADNNGDNSIGLTWNAVPGIESYQIFRSEGDCPQGSAQLIASGVTETSFFDDTVSGGITYNYTVKGFNPNSRSCTTQSSNCVQVTATGSCLLPPTFAGITSATNLQTETCAIQLGWDAATGICTQEVTYNIYRSTTSGFTPGKGNLLASCVADTSFVDESAEFGVPYYYIVRAEDNNELRGLPCSGGNEDSNTVEAVALAGGPDQIGFEDDMESGDANWSTETGGTDSGTTAWALTNTGTENNGTSFFTADEDDVKDQSLILDVTISGDSVMTFDHKVITENNWDGGVLEYSTDGGTTWNDILDGDGGNVPANSERMIAGGYSSPLNAGTSENPLAGRNSWNGTLNGGAFFTTEVDLGDFIGESVTFRWRMGCDGSVGSEGWWVDNIQTLTPTTCEAAPQCEAVADYYPLWPARTILEMLSDCPEFTNLP